MLNKKIIDANDPIYKKDNIYLIDNGLNLEDDTSKEPQIWDIFYYEKYFDKSKNNIIKSYKVNNYSKTLMELSKKQGFERNIKVQDGFHTILINNAEKLKREEIIKKIEEALKIKSTDEEIKDVKNRLTKIEDQLSTLINLLKADKT